METVYRDYSAKGVRFFYVYKALAHPETNGYITPFSLAERLLHVKEAQRTLGSGVTWLCDTMSNSAKHSLGDAPNSEFIVDPKGVILVRRAWSDPKKLRADLERLVGPVERITQVSELDLKKQPPALGAKSGVVPRLKLDGQFNAVQVTPQPSGHPFYVKLRAEADEGLLRRGNGRLYLGFLLDPLYHVHWNNLAAPIQFTIQVAAAEPPAEKTNQEAAPPSSEVVPLSPTAGTGPKVEEPADIDPREFVVAVHVDANSKNRPPLRLKVDYYACHDEQGWCKHIVQEYEVRLVADRDGGWVQARRRGQRTAGGDRAPAGQPAPGAERPRPSGTVVKVDLAARMLTMRLRTGNERTVRVLDDAPVNFKGRDGTLADLKQGDRVMVELARPAGDGEPVIAKIVALRLEN